MSQLDETKYPIGLPASILGEVFPFHIAFDRDLRTVQLGRGLSKICPELKVGDAIADHFTLITPAVDLTFKGISDQLFTVFFIQYQHSQVVLKGQMLFQSQDHPDHMVFLCSPVVRDLSSLSELGMTLNDFAIHDSVMDFLVLLQTKSNTINDVRKMAERLKKEVGVRREAEKDLQQVNEELEERVAARTQELKVLVDKLERNNHEISLLNVMGDMLQACRTIQETHDVIVDILQQLFPDESGMFALYDEVTEEFEVAACWGDLESVGQHFAGDDCWGVRRNKIHVHESGRNDAICNHLKESPPHGYICVPLLAQGRLMGLIHLQSAMRLDEDEEVGRRLTRSESRRQLIHTAADHVGLALANLKLQESLRIQSIRDPLTGLYNRRHMEDSSEREMARAIRRESSVGIIMMDVDHFKKFNDNYGHEAGDVLLAEMGVQLQRQLRAEDIPCRYGGEEFILILPSASVENTAQRAEQIRHDVEKYLRLEHKGVDLPQVTISLGVSGYPTCANSAKEAVSSADAALYRAKEAGRNRVEIASDL